MHEGAGKPGNDVILSVEDLAVHFPVGGGLLVLAAPQQPVRSGPTPTFMKSITLPRITRSTRFEAPPAK